MVQPRWMACLLNTDTFASFAMITRTVMMLQLLMSKAPYKGEDVCPSAPQLTIPHYRACLLN